MTNKQKIEKWLDKQIKLQKGINNASELAINKKLSLCTCGSKDYIQLYKCLHQIAEILELPVTTETKECTSGDYVEYSFIYHDFKFIEL